ncbi:hypothetical protein M0657_005338 [Pyricularia oryzae]|nr:hypothetical protein M9X92_005805 [Pyricularia oryzae]KAI7923016.1 hypothetical protein M0657_005338 [Pyricularia oryzae]
MSYLFIKTNFIGVRAQFIREHDPKPGRRWNYAVQVLYNPILPLVKASILVPLFRGKSRYQLPDAETGMTDNKSGKKGRSRGGIRKQRPIQSRDVRVLRINDATSPSLTEDKKTDLRGRSPRRRRRRSAENTMTSANGIMRLSDVQREIDVLVKDLAVGPGGSYLLKRPTGHDERERQEQFRREMEQMEREVRSRQQAAAAPRKPPSEANFSSYAAGVVSCASSQAGPRIGPRTRSRTRNRDFSEARKPKHGDKRNGVIPPSEPTAPAWPF